MPLPSIRFPNLHFPVRSDQVDVGVISDALSAYDKSAAFDPFITEILVNKDDWKTGDDIDLQDLRTLISGYAIKTVTFDDYQTKTYTHAFGTVKIDNTASNIEMVNDASRSTTLITDIVFSHATPIKIGTPYTADIHIQARTRIPSQPITFEMWFW
jgi:hypothetical protein